MSSLAVVLIVVGVVVVLLLAGGFVAVSRRARGHEGEYAAHVEAADRALEAARAADRGWDRSVLEDVARAALNEQRPGWDYESLELVLVEDRPGIEDDRAQFRATDGSQRVELLLTRGEGGWKAERIG